jgi:SAM-dependent methyltransferase
MADLAGEHFWARFWHRQHARRFAGASYFHLRMRRLLEQHVSPGSEVCEVGCGASTWLPVLAGRGARTWGIDYSPDGLAIARANLERLGATATLILADVRDDNALPAGRFDVMFSAGLIEHFDDPESLLRTIARALRPGGVLITLVPNFAGIWGAIQRRVDPELYAVHRVYTCAELDRVHGDAGLDVVTACEHFGGFGPLVVNYSRPLHSWPPPLRAAAIGGLWAVQQLIAWGLTAGGARDGAAYSSHLLGVYSRPEGPS